MLILTAKANSNSKDLGSIGRGLIASRNMLKISHLSRFVRKYAENIGLSPTIAPKWCKMGAIFDGFSETVPITRRTLLGMKVGVPGPSLSRHPPRDGCKMPARSDPKKLLSNKTFVPS